MDETCRTPTQRQLTPPTPSLEGPTGLPPEEAALGGGGRQSLTRQQSRPAEGPEPSPTPQRRYPEPVPAQPAHRLNATQSLWALLAIWSQRTNTPTLKLQRLSIPGPFMCKCAERRCVSVCERSASPTESFPQLPLFPVLMCSSSTSMAGRFKKKIQSYLLFFPPPVSKQLSI